MSHVRKYVLRLMRADHFQSIWNKKIEELFRMVQRSIWINIVLIWKLKVNLIQSTASITILFYYCKNTFLHKYCFAWNIFLIKWIFFHLFCTCNIFCNILHFICCKKQKHPKQVFPVDPSLPNPPSHPNQNPASRRL